jgi:single-stranded-DNA-specific exonuclease
LSLTGKQWLIQDCDERERDALVGALGVSPVVAHLLVNRGLKDPAEARCFLEPDLGRLHDPGLLPDMEKAVQRVRRALTNQERILVYGDYDADGVTATSLLLQFLRLLGAEPTHYIPNRVKEGYGVHAEAIEAAAADGVNLIVTVDCGTSAVAEVELARQLGMDVVITDHHEPAHTVPRAEAVVNPKLTGSLYPFRDLSGVGVAFKLVWALAQSLSPGKRVSEGFRTFLLDAIGLVALGTVADVVPLTGENRIFTIYGLHALRRSKNTGLVALIRQAGIAETALTPRDISFKMGPRLNAAGRLAEAGLCVELLTCASPDRASAIARELDDTNRERQRIQTRILEDARERLAGISDMESRRAIVLADEGWHAGVLGIVAAKLAEEFNRPTVLLSLDGELARGSARSVPHFDLFAAVEACEDTLLSFGGHSQAAGIKVLRSSLGSFSERFEREALRHLGDWQPCGTVEIDAEVALGAVGIGLIRDLERLAPHGEGNPLPVLACSDVVVAGRPQLMGARGQHVAFYVRQGERSLRAVGFRMGEIYDAIATGDVVCDVAFAPKINDFRGPEEVELELCDVRLRH